MFVLFLIGIDDYVDCNCSILIKFACCMHFGLLESPITFECQHNLKSIKLAVFTRELDAVPHLVHSDHRHGGK